MMTMCVKYFPCFAGAGGSKGAAAEDPGPPQPANGAARAPEKSRRTSGKAREERLRRAIILKVSSGRGGHPFPVPLLPAQPESIALAAEVLRGGGVVAFPTETVYGLGALALEPSAVARIFEIKERPHFDPLIVHVLDRPMLKRVVPRLSRLAEALIERFWPGPLTLVLPKGESVPGLVTAGLASVAVRMPSHWIARSLLAAVDAPLAAPSANRFGSLSPTRAEHVAESLGERVNVILDGGPTEHGIESTIVALEPEPVLLRPGAIPVEALEAVTGRLARGSEAEPARAPGQLPRHYAPRTPLRLVEPAGVNLQERRHAGALVLREGSTDMRRSECYRRAEICARRQPASSRPFTSLTHWGWNASTRSRFRKTGWGLRSWTGSGARPPAETPDACHALCR